MADQATSEYKEVIEAYVANDPVRAAALRDMDDYLDDLHRQFVAQIFESHATGTVHLQGRDITNIPPRRRPLGMVFQRYALFPHMSVRSNIEYGHRLTPPDRRRIHPDQLVDLLGLGGLVAVRRRR